MAPSTDWRLTRLLMFEAVPNSSASIRDTRETWSRGGMISDIILVPLLHTIHSTITITTTTTTTTTTILLNTHTNFSWTSATKRAWITLKRSFVIHFGTNQYLVYDFISRPLIVTVAPSWAVSEILRVLYAESHFLQYPLLFRLKFGFFL